MLIPLKLGGGGSDLSFVTAGAGQILTGYTGSNTEGEAVSGSIPINNSVYTVGTDNEYGTENNCLWARFPANRYWSAFGGKAGMGYLYVPLSYLGGTAASSVLSGQTFTSTAGIKVSGTMTNRGAWTSSVSPNGTTYIPAGYHNGSGYISCRAQSSTYTYSRGSGGTVDLGASNSYRYVNAGNVYNYGYDVGYSAGNTAGYNSGYSAGHAAGKNAARYIGNTTSSSGSVSWTEARAGGSWFESSDPQISVNPGLGSFNCYVAWWTSDAQYASFGWYSYGGI